MKHDDNTPQDTPEMAFPAGVSHYHPINQSMTSIHMASNFNPDDPPNDGLYRDDQGRTIAELEALAAEMIATLEFERIRDLGDPAIIMATQARVMDAVFNRFITLGFAPRKNPDLEKIRFALMAQRQCTAAFAKLNGRRRRKVK